MTRIPQTDSVSELARFWDTHDVTEFENDLEEVHELVFDGGRQIFLRVYLESDQAAALHRIAQAKGVDETELVRDWVTEKLRTP